MKPPSPVHALRTMTVLMALLFTFFCQELQAEELIGRYKLRGTDIDYSITIPQERPAAAIIIQYLPAGTEVLSSCPAFSSYDPETGEMRWLFTNPEAGLLRISLKLAEPLAAQQVRAEALFQDHSGQSSNYAIRPAPMKRRVLEGC